MNSAKTVCEVPMDLIEDVRSVLAFAKSVKARIEDPVDRWLDAKAAAKYIKVSKTTLERNLREELPPSKHGRRMVYDRHDLDKFWESRKEK